MLSRKPITPIDRAVADVERQIAEIEQQLHSTGTAPPPQQKLTDAVKEWLRPPARRPAIKTSSAACEVHADPMKELNAGGFPFAHQPEPDLFNRVPQADASVKLGEYLSAGSMRPKSPLKHVQRANRQKFYV